MDRRSGVNGRIRKTFLFSVIFFLTASTAFAEFSRLDPLLSPGSLSQSLRRPGASGKEKPGLGERVTVLIRFTGDLSGVTALGGVVRSAIGDVATVDLPAAQLQAAAALPNIIYIEAPRKLKTKLDASVPETRADQLRSGPPPNWTGNTGRNVIIGIIDSGLDLTHQNFKDKNGKTRVRFLWDQTIVPGIAAVPPAGYSYGKECTNLLIDSGKCGSVDGDDHGHGTHVAGIAAGNGSATGNGRPAYRYVGMAPEADLIIVRLSQSQSFSDSIVDGIKYIQDKAQALGRPSVINLSLGEQAGPHDGTSNFERAMDNASGPGRIIVAAAGNEGTSPLLGHADGTKTVQTGGMHAAGTVPQGGSKRISLSVPAGTPFAEVHLWYPGQSALSFRVLGPGSCATPLRSAGNDDYLLDDPTCGGIFISTPVANPNNQDKEILLGLFDTETHSLSRGTWQLELTEGGNSNVKFDAYADDLTGPFNEQNLFSDISDFTYSGTLASPASASKVIAVGSYVTKSIWQVINGQTWYDPDPKSPENPKQTGILSDFSSQGPLRACTLCAPAGSIRKPEIAAPGEMIMSSAFNQSSPRKGEIDPSGVYQVKAGTSMAAPHVTGAVALLLQAAPTLTSDEIKGIFAANSKADSFTGPLPNDFWGYGKLDAKAAFDAAPNPPPASPEGLSAGPGDGSMALTWTAGQELDIDGYHVYRSTTSGSGFTRLTSSFVRTPSFSDTGLTNGTTYFYRVSSVDTKGQEGAPSAETSAVAGAPAGSSGGGCALAGPGDVDPMLIGLAVLALLLLGFRRIQS